MLTDRIHWLIRAVTAAESQGRRRLIESAAAEFTAHGAEQSAATIIATVLGPAARWLEGILLERLGHFDDADASYSRAIDNDGRELPDVLLRRSRLALRLHDKSRAVQLLRYALSMSPDYDFLIRSEALVRKCADAASYRRNLRIALVSSTSTSFLRTAIALLCFRDRIKAEFYEAPFGAYRQEILDSRSGLYRFRPDLTIMILTWRDAILADLSEDPELQAQRIAGELAMLWHTLLERVNCEVFQTTLIPPAIEPLNALSHLLPGGRSRILNEVNRMLLRVAPPRVTLIDLTHIALTHRGTWENLNQWAMARIYPATDAQPGLAEAIASCIRSAVGIAYKVLAVDLDNTLWGGVIGEDGLTGIRLGPPSPSGELYQDLQRYIKALKQRGVVLAAVSKNNFEDAADVFRKHPGSILCLEDFAVFRVNWNDKADNLRDIAVALKLDLDSFVYLDDNPAERAAIRAALPSVAVVETSGDPAVILSELHAGLYFQAIRYTEEDKARAASYAARVKGEQIRYSTTSVDDHLSHLEMELDYGPVDDATCTRVTQLINKTNQFNLTTRRYTEGQIRARMSSDVWWCYWFRMRDRFADHGLIGVLIAERSTDAWTIDSWLMSCRVIGRGLERFMLNCLLTAASAEGTICIEASYVPTEKNTLVSDLLPTLGFVESPIVPHSYSLNPWMMPRAPTPHFRFLSRESP